MSTNREKQFASNHKLKNIHINRTYKNVMATLGLATSLYAAEPWTMHKIDNAMWNHNSLSPWDLNGDGYADYAVVHEDILANCEEHYNEKKVTIIGVVWFENEK